MQSKLKVAVVQDSSVPFDAAATTEKTCRLIAEAAAGGAQFVHYMPSLRSTMYGQGVEIYCAPRADDRATWLPTMQHVAMEGRCYVLSACQFIRLKEFGDNYRSVLANNPEDAVMRGGSVIVGPLGEILAGPVFDRAVVLYAELDNATLIKSKMDFDPVGHYARADVFSLKVDRSAKVPVQFVP